MDVVISTRHSPIPNGTADYLYLGVQCVEERNPFGGQGATDTPLLQYVWGRYVDELLQQREGIDGENPTHNPGTVYHFRLTAAAVFRGHGTEWHDSS